MGAVLVAIVASFGNLLQGWDNATIAGAVLYIKKEFGLGSEPAIEGLIVAMSLIGATIVTTFSGAVADAIGRRPLLIISSVLYFLSGIIMLWSPNVYVLLLARLIDGFGIGLAVTLVPLYISETAPSEMRGLLNTLPQFAGSGGMFLSYCMVFGMSLMANPDWRLMLGVLSLPSVLYFALTVLYLPESPRWLVSKGKMSEAKRVLQKLRGREDVSGELALLVEGLRVGGETSIEEYLIGPADELRDEEDPTAEKEKIMLCGPEAGQSLVARPIKGQSIRGSALGALFRKGSMANQNIPFMDPMVTLFGSVHEKVPDLGASMRSILFPNFGSMFNLGGHPSIHEQWDEDIAQRDDDDYVSDAERGDSDDNLQSPLLSRQTTSMEGKDIVPSQAAHGSIFSMRQSSIMPGTAGEAVSSMGIGGGWQLAWKWSEREAADGTKREGFKRIYLRPEGIPGSQRGSVVSLLEGDIQVFQAAALVSQPALYSKELMEMQSVGPAMVHPSEITSKGPRWGDIFDAGVKHALVVGIGIQILQQFSGINGVLYYTPQILEQSGVDVLLDNIGISSDSASILICALTTLLMLPAIGVAMKLMDIAGRRSLLLATIPVLIVTLVVLVITNLVNMGSVAHAVLSIVSVAVYFCCFVVGFGPVPNILCVAVYFCCFVVGFGPVPNILCAEIFPTSVRGICVAICSLTFWVGNIAVTYTLPVMLRSIGLAGVFGIYAVVCAISMVFVFLKVPETKGMPLEVITEFFAVGAKQAAGS